MRGTFSIVLRRLYPPSLNSPERHWVVGLYWQQLSLFSPTLATDLERAACAVEADLTVEQIVAWADDGLKIACHSWRSWEVACEYFRVTPNVISLLGQASLQDWASEGRSLMRISSALAAAYYRASPRVLSNDHACQLSDWAALGRRLYKGTWRSVSLAVRFFEVSPALFTDMTIGEVASLVQLVNTLSERSYDLASRCLDMAQEALSPLEGADRLAFLDFGEVLAAVSWAEVRSYFESGAILIASIHPSKRSPFLAIARGVLSKEGRGAFGSIAGAAQALAVLDVSQHPMFLSLASKLAASSPVAGMEFLRNLPFVLQRIRVKDVEAWHAGGMRVLEIGQDGVEAYFRLESTRGQETLELLSARVELVKIRDVLRMYCRALTGIDVDMRPAGELAERRIGWLDTELPSTEGTAIFLPSFIDDYDDKAGNFSAYKVYCTHQAGHLEFGSFRFEFDRDGGLFHNLRRELEAQQAESSPEDVHLTEMGRFLALFSQRRLASDLFAILEDARVDAQIAREYCGVRDIFRMVQLRALARRPEIESLPILQAILENLVRASLGATETIRWPASQFALGSIFDDALEVLRAIQGPGVLVEDAADATIHIYQLLADVKNQLATDHAEDWRGPNQESNSWGSSAGEADGKINFDRHDEATYKSPQPVEFRGEFKPELVQLLALLRRERSEDQRATEPVSMERLMVVIENDMEASKLDLSDAGQASSQQILSNLAKEISGEMDGSVRNVGIHSEEESSPNGGSTSGKEEEEGLRLEPSYSYYDEWDFRTGDYKPRWCKVLEYLVPEGESQFFDSTLASYPALAEQTRREFELLRPEVFRKEKGLLDGEEFDLDAVVECVTEMMAGWTPTGKIYWRRNKKERDVSLVFLLDMSASTDEEITKREYGQAERLGEGSQHYYSWWMARRERELAAPPKRIIDLEKESIVVLIHGLEAIGDVYGIYGFSGYGRENVEFHIIKDILEPFSEKVKRRVDSVAPVRSTRMGPAIRHATTKLESCDSKVRILFLLSDGRPQDHRYGRDRIERDYAIHDTHMALIEAKHKGIVPFCLTVDRYGHDYLKAMCGDIGYAAVPDIETLPSTVTNLYRRLTR